MAEALAEIASLLRMDRHERQAADIEALRQAALAMDPLKQAWFRSEITQNKWYWLGMGTIADISFYDRRLRSQFVRAYCRLAQACESAGLDSVYSRDVADIFGQWIRDGAV